MLYGAIVSWCVGSNGHADSLPLGQDIGLTKIQGTHQLKSKLIIIKQTDIPEQQQLLPVLLDGAAAELRQHDAVALFERQRHHLAGLRVHSARPNGQHDALLHGLARLLRDQDAGGGFLIDSWIRAIYRSKTPLR